ncbi:MAG: D-sedoheptulose 7-phosphate isomerase [Chloroflexota bacterium]
MSDESNTLDAIFEEHIKVARASRETLLETTLMLCDELSEALESGGKLLVFGNGGSAADAQHFAAELVGRFKRSRPGLPALALTTNTSALTAIANDWDYDHVFARQVEGLCQPHDFVVGISTSGGAESVASGLRAARERGAATWALTGAGGGKVAEAAERSLRVPSTVTARIQEMHITLIHAVSEIVEARLAAFMDRAD